MNERELVFYEPELTADINYSERKEKIDTYKTRAEELDIAMPKASANDHFFDTELDEKSILVVGLGTNVKGNMYYILDELNTNAAFSDYKIYVRTKDKTDEVVKEFIRKNNWNRCETVPKAYTKKLETCKYMICESYFPENWIWREGQVMIDLWHGTPLKRIGLAKSGQRAHTVGVHQKNFINADYLLYPNEYTKDKLLSSYRISTLLPGKELMAGYPRVGGLLQTGFFRKRELKKKLAPHGEKLYAYMPTYWGYYSDEKNIAMTQEMLSFLDEKLSDRQLLYVNLHHHVATGLDCSQYKHIKYFPSDMDNYELLSVTDALITDYSSVFFDYLATGKQIILYVEYEKEYEKDQGIYIDLKELPFDLAYSKQAVVDALNNGKTYDDSAIKAEICPFDSADNAKKICRLFLGDESAVTVKEHPHNDKEKILLYSDCFRPGETTEKLHGYLKAYDHEKMEITLGCDAKKTGAKENLKGAYPMLYENPVIGVTADPKLSSAGEGARALYLAGELSLEEAMDFLKYDYSLVGLRQFGRVVFDTIIIYDTLDPNMVISLAMMKAGKKILCLMPEVFESISDGNYFLKDAIAYAARYCSAVVVKDSSYIEKAERFLGESWTGKIQQI